MTETDPALMSAETLLALYARRALSPVEALQGGHRAGRALQPLGQRLRHHEPAARCARPARARRAGRPAGRSGCSTACPRTVKDLLNIAGFPTRRGSRTTDADPGHRGCAGGAGAEGGRRGHHRQDHHHRIRLEIARRLPAARHHPQPLGPRAHAGRLLLRRRRGGGGRLRAAAYRHRCRRLHPHPGRLLRAGRDEAQLRARPAMAARRLRHRRLRRADDAHRARRRADAVRPWRGTTCATPSACPTTRATGAPASRTGVRGHARRRWCAGSASTRRSMRKARRRCSAAARLLRERRAPIVEEADPRPARHPRHLRPRLGRGAGPARGRPSRRRSAALLDAGLEEVAAREGGMSAVDFLGAEALRIEAAHADGPLPPALRPGADRRHPHRRLRRRPADACARPRRCGATGRPGPSPST